MSDSDQIKVCDQCLRASCWQGVYMCDDNLTAGTTRKTIRELRELKLEHESYWKTDDELTDDRIAEIEKDTFIDLLRRIDS